ncbi:ThiF family adenylyltransferase [Amycolatopsis endophytica]|uniref:Bacteriocin biosynthesis cyclodehydratase domain-containing protein n=1 Tax=Amycolatopsis endophytica TaxID=860233 RepID=A0A853AXI2_9PSEU|nr:TOMM precursor leader peptide-binding protein [Amycolatopsis endophytica]NYI87339.1 bacteriocin biosynthesis cyclodehydratase domain-containing protein [Amycolatopsis endophytica]
MTNTAITPRPVFLPERPWLRPGLEIFDRGPGEIQIGVDPRHAMMARDLPPDVVRVLHRLDGSLRLESLFALAESEHVELLRDLLTQLTHLGLVEEAWAPAAYNRIANEAGLWSLSARQSHGETVARRRHSAIVLYGSGRVTVAMAVQLAAAGVGHVRVEAAGKVADHDTGSGYTDTDIGRSRTAAAADAIRRANSATVTRRLRDGRNPELAVLADAVVPAPELVRQLMQEKIPHLAVRVREGIGIVGPLVYPGRSSCLGCADLIRRSMDERWPTVAGQLAGRSQPADLVSVQATAALATGQVLRALGRADGIPPGWNTTLEIDPYECTIYHRPWPPHPSCSCGARPEPLVRGVAPRTAAEGAVGKAQSQE